MKTPNIKEKVLKEDGYIQDYSMYGFKSSPFSEESVLSFSKNNKMVIKDELSIGQYVFILRPPEHSTFKIDLNKVLPEREERTKQIRIDFTEEEFKKTISPFVIKALDKYSAEIGKVINEGCGRQKSVNMFNFSECKRDSLCSTCKGLKQKLGIK